MNGYPHADNHYRDLAHRRFRDFRIGVGGLVEHPTMLTIAELRRLGFVQQVTKHNCIQGWSAVAEWGGVPLAALLDHVIPKPNARYVVFHALDDKSRTDTEGRTGYYYTTLPIEVARRSQTILALEIRAIELVADFAQVGQGQGGWREDQQYYETIAAI